MENLKTAFSEIPLIGKILTIVIAVGLIYALIFGISI